MTPLVALFVSIGGREALLRDEINRRSGIPAP
jgi:hypothetical protein